jgi:hypothetical protein
MVHALKLKLTGKTKIEELFGGRQKYFEARLSDGKKVWLTEDFVKSQW